MSNNIDKLAIPFMTAVARVKPLKNNKEFPGGIVRFNDIHSSLTAIPTGRSDAIVLIDSGEDRDANNIKSFLKNRKLNFSNIVATLITHAHADHTGGLDIIGSESKSVTFISEPDSKVLSGERRSQGPIPGLFDLLTHKNLAAATSIKPEIIKDDQIIEIDDLVFRCISMPGHTDGSVGFVVSNDIVGYNLFFPGDALDFSFIGKKVKNAYKIMTNNNEQSRLSIISARDRINDLGINIDFVIPSHSGEGDFELLQNFR